MGTASDNEFLNDSEDLSCDESEPEERSMTDTEDSSQDTVPVQNVSDFDSEEEYEEELEIEEIVERRNPPRACRRNIEYPELDNSQ